MRMKDKSSSLIGVYQLSTVMMALGTWQNLYRREKILIPKSWSIMSITMAVSCRQLEWINGVYYVLCVLIVSRRMDEWVRAACIESVNQDPAAIVGDHVQQEGSKQKMM